MAFFFQNILYSTIILSIIFYLYDDNDASIEPTIFNSRTRFLYVTAATTSPLVAFVTCYDSQSNSHYLQLFMYYCSNCHHNMAASIRTTSNHVPHAIYDHTIYILHFFLYFYT
jgi:cytochrome c1